MNPARRCSLSLSQTLVSSLGGQTWTPAPGPARGPGVRLRPAPGGAMGSCSSRSFGTMTPVLNSAPLAQPDTYFKEGPDQDPDKDSVEVDPDQLLRECKEVLQRRPARPHRDLVHPRSTVRYSHKHNPNIRVMQWNILAQALGEGKDGFLRCPLEALSWPVRKYLILEEILTHLPDILCLQEVDHYYDTFQPILTSLGYRGSFLAKPCSPCLDVDQNNGPDGCALFSRRSRFTVLRTSGLRLSAMMLPTNQVAIVQTLACRVTGRRLCVAVTHLKARSGWERLRSAQGAHLLQSLRAITSRGHGPNQDPEGTIPLVVCGDFNAEPSEDVYRRFSSSPLGLNSAYKLLSSDGQVEPDEIG
ncbi:nocturnin, partial [Austrofundulus limnaeus]|uniref:Nocturnin n=1 Tax=Austrofundulus limnaeus TaxID=52670 RepID=A0A2I4AJB4_AUSLI